MIIAREIAQRGALGEVAIHIRFEYFPAPEKNAFIIPYSFFVDFPEGKNGEAVNEWLFLFATKSKFDALDLESFENLHKRFDELGKENWRLELAGFTILSE